MNFNEFHNSEYWERQRQLKAGQITIAKLVMIISFGIAFFGMAFFGLMYLAIILEG